MSHLAATKVILPSMYHFLGYNQYMYIYFRKQIAASAVQNLELTLTCKEADSTIFPVKVRVCH